MKSLTTTLTFEVMFKNNNNMHLIGLGLTRTTTFNYIMVNNNNINLPCLGLIITTTLIFEGYGYQQQ